MVMFLGEKSGRSRRERQAMRISAVVAVGGVLTKAAFFRSTISSVSTSQVKRLKDLNVPKGIFGVIFRAPLV